MNHQQEIEIIRRYLGVKGFSITVSEDGFMSRGYVINGGEYVFKFKKHPNVSYKNEIALLNTLNTMQLGVHLQRVAYPSETDSYLGLYGVRGTSLEHLDAPHVDALGEQLGHFLQKLHAASPATDQTCSISEELEAWQHRYQKGKPIFKAHFSAEELAIMDRFMLDQLPEELLNLGEDLVFSHGDLGDGNIYVDQNGEIGIIDFNESGYLDRAADFMDISNGALCRIMLDTYNADEALRRKVTLRRIARPLFTTETYARRGEERQQITKIKEWLKGDRHVYHIRTHH